MDLYLQFGHGMMTLSQDLIQSWGGGTVILSPRDLELEQMVRLKSVLSQHNGSVVIDPQFYIPRSDHERLTAHAFWPDEYQTSFFSRPQIERMLRSLYSDYITPLNADFFILPSLRSSSIDDDWYNYNSEVVDIAQSLSTGKALYVTLCLSSEVLVSEDAIHQLIEYISTWDVAGFYLVPEPPSNSYLVDDPNWLLNLADLSAAIKLLNRKVVVGYSNHQMLLLAVCNVDALASGTWLNVRSFSEARFRSAQDAISRRSKWYYCPQAMSEYQIPILDLARRLGLLDDIKTEPNFGSAYADILFSGALPSSTNYLERDSFKHYLQCFRHQALTSVSDSYHATRDNLRLQLEAARDLTGLIQANGINGRDRDFANVVDSTISALLAFDTLLGLRIEHGWAQMS